MLNLKEYQQQTLSTLRTYLEAARVDGPKAAFEAVVEGEQKRREQYRSLAGLEDVPYVCLRLPTGGGKTILASHSIQVAAKAYLEQDYPLVLWLVPTNTIRSQTLEALKKPHHPYREAIDDAFEGRVAVYDIAEIDQIRPQDLTERVCVIVGTLATLRVNNTEGRRIYAHSENFEPHFSRVPQSTPGMERIEEGPDRGKLKFSFANLLHLHQPLVIVDEAHNAVSDLTYEVWQRIRPACIIEFTATPVTNNVLCRVSASQVKAAEMIKLPIMLTEHQNWQEALHDAILTRSKLQEAAENDRDYIRPLVLIQAENRDREQTVEVIRQHLIDNEGIEPEKIAVATGVQRELDGINLFDPACRIEYIITVEALKEGWDCSFAYVFCTVANLRSSKNVEQFLGRVLRMPYAKRRADDQLNRAYAHVASPCFAEAARLLHDRLVDRMGFDEAEAEAFIQHEQPKLLDNGPLFRQPAASPLILSLPEKPDFDALPPEVQARIKIKESADGVVQVTVTGEISEELAEQLVQAVDKKSRSEVQKVIKTHRYYQQRTLTPAERGEVFRMPRLCVQLQGELELAEKELFLDACGWKLTEYPAELTEAEFGVQETSRTFELDIREKHLVYGLVDNDHQIDLAHVHTDWNEVAFARVLDKELRQPDVKQEVMLEFLRRLVVHLEKRRGIELSVQVRFKYPLIKALAAKIADYRLQAQKRGYQETLFGPTARVEASFDYAVSFKKDGYAPNSCYRGRYLFRKHFYPVVGDLEPKGEEFDCAQIIDSLPQVKYWVRNLVGQPQASFWLPTATDRFYPDFVAELNDGRQLVIEYKGGHISSAADAEEKCAIGDLWEKKSAGKGLFFMAVKVDEHGRDVRQQLIDKFK